MPVDDHNRAFLAGGGEMGTMMRAHDWSTSPAGPLEGWPQSLRSVVGLMLANKHIMFVAWGPELAFLYNDAYRPVFGKKHPWALGRPFKEVWSEVWDEVEPLVNAALGGEATWSENLHLILERNGYPEDCWFTFSYSPVRDEDGKVAGIFCAASETTDTVLTERRLKDQAERQKQLFQKAPGFIAIVTGPDHTFDFVNEAYVQLVGRRDAVGRTVRQVFPDLEGQGLFELLDGVFTKGKRFVGEGLSLTLQTSPDQPSRDVILDFIYEPIRDESDRITGIFIEGHDVTEAHLARAALSETEGRFRALVNATANVVYRMAPDWRELRRLDGAGFIVDTDAPTTDWIETYIPADERPRLREAIERAFGAKDVFELEHRVLRADGTVGWAHSRAIPLLDDAGEIVEWFGAASDVTARVKADQSFTRLFEASPAPFLVLAPDAPHFTIREVNDAYLAATMRTREEVVGRGVFEAYPDNPDDATVGGVSRLRASLERVLATRRPDELLGLHYDVARPDGTYEVRWWRTVNSPILDENGEVEVIIHNANDVTAERRAEAELRESETLLSAVLDALPVGVILTDAQGRVIRDNAANRTLWGVLPETIGFEQYSEWVGWWPETGKRIEGTDWAMARALLHGETVENELVENQRFGTGERRFILNNAAPVQDASGTIVGGVVAQMDITERLAAERAVKQLNETLEERVIDRTAERDRLWELSPDLLTIVNYEGRLLRVNPSWTRVLGYEEDWLLTHPCVAMLHPDEIASIGALLAEMRTTQRSVMLENRMLAADGTWRSVVWTLSPEPGGEQIYIIGRDVTDERAREKDMAVAKEALHQSQKMEAMGLLTGGVAHDFNNLLTPIIGSLDMLVRRGIGSERERRMIDGAMQSAERAKILVQRLLAFARRQPLQPVAVDIPKLVEGMVGLIGSTLGPTIDVRVNIDPDLPPAKADPNQLEMALLNLAVNARDAMPDGGELTIQAKRESVSQGHASSLNAGDYVLLRVVDTGVGMDEETRQRAIEPFFSTKGIGKGTGLGLSMVHGLVAQLGGGLTIDSAPSKGTTIALWLPISTTAIGVEEVTAATPATRVGRGVALLVDDDDLVRMSTADMLIDLGFEVVEASSAEEALQLLNTGTKPDLLITDHLRPGMNGADLAREARAIEPTLPILIVSGYAEVDGVAPDLPRLTKPFRNAELAESISALIPIAG